MLFSTLDLWELRIALLLHDIGKVHPKHYAANHQKRSTGMIQSSLDELKKNKMLKESIERIELYINYHHGKWPKTKDSKEEWGLFLIRVADIASSIYQKRNVEAFCDKQSSIIRSFPTYSKHFLISQTKAKHYEKSISDVINSFLKGIKAKKIEDIFNKFLKNILITVNENPNQDIYHILTEVPSDTRFPINDHSLYSHLKAACLIVANLVPFFNKNNQQINGSICLVKLNFKTKERLLQTIRIKDATGRIELHNFFFKTLMNELMKQHILITINSGKFDYNISWENVVYPDPIRIFRLHETSETTTPAIDEFIIIVPGNKKVIHRIIGDTINSVIKIVSEKFSLSFQELSLYFQPWLCIKEEKISEIINLRKPWIIGSMISKKIEEMLNTESYDLNNLLINNLHINNTANFSESKFCSSCGLFHGKSSLDSFDYVCTFCEKIRELGKGAWIDDIADSNNDIARFTLEAKNLDKWLSGEIKSKFSTIGLDMPRASLERSHSLARTIELDLRVEKAMSNCVKLIENEMRKYKFRRIHAKFNAKGKNIPNVPVLGNFQLNGETYGAYFIKTNNEIQVEVIGIPHKKKVDFKKALENTPEIKISTRQREFCLKEIKNITFLEKIIQFKIISQSNALLEVLLPGKIGFEISIKINKSFFEETGMEIKSSCLIFNKKQPLPQLRG